MNAYREVSKAELERFLSEYQGPFSAGLSQVCDPPIRHYYDKTLPSKGEVGSAERFFDMVIAKVECEWMGPDGKTSDGEDFWTYHIKEVVAPDPDSVLGKAIAKRERRAQIKRNGGRR